MVGKLAFAQAVLMAAASVDARPGSEPGPLDPMQVIALEEGIWDASIMSADGKRLIATGVQINELVSRGKWMLNRMSVNGGQYQGTGVWGHDPLTGQYSGTWVDDGLARMRTDKGQWNAATMTMTWTADAVLADGTARRIRAISSFSGNTRTYRSFALTPAGDVPVSWVVFVRRGPVRAR